jgi:hypothetical protein
VSEGKKNNHEFEISVLSTYNLDISHKTDHNYFIDQSRRRWPTNGKML